MADEPKEYRVRWEIDILATSEREAAEKALKIQRDPESIATVFDVQGGPGRGLQSSSFVTIDLLDDEGDAAD